MPRETSLMTSENMTLRIVRPLDVGVIVDADALGMVEPLQIRSLHGSVALPRFSEGSVVAPYGFERSEIFPDGPFSSWGGWTKGFQERGTGQVKIESLGFELQISRARVDIPPEIFDQGYVKGLHDVHQEISAWLARLRRWGQLMFGQPLDLRDPTPGVLSHPSDLSLTWGELDGKLSWADSSPPPKDIVLAQESTHNK